MSGQRSFVPGWDRPQPFGQASAGLNPPSSFRMNVANQGTSPNADTHMWSATLPSPNVQDRGSSNLRRSSSHFGFGGHQNSNLDAGIPTPNVSFNTDESHSPMAEADRVFNIGRDIGRLETELASAKEKWKFFESETIRLRRQRDEAREDSVSQQQQIAELRHQLNEIRSNPQRPTPLVTPEKRSAFSFGRRPSGQSSESSNSIVAGGLNISTFSPMSQAGMQRSPDPKTPHFTPAVLQHGSAVSTPIVMPAKLARRSLQDNLADFFQHSETWAGKYATLRPNAVVNQVYLGALKARCQAMCKPRDVDDLLADEVFRYQLAAAFINKTLSTYLGPQCIEGFDFPACRELEDVIREVREVRPQNARAHHELLEKRASLYRVAFKDERLEAWLDLRVNTILEDLFQMLHPLIPAPGHSAAQMDLRRIIKEALGIGQIMLAMPREWGIFFAQRGERWDYHCMVQRDERIKADPKLTESNGFAFVVRLGIAPSVTEKDFSTGAMNLQTLHPRTVLLVENVNQKTTPQSQRKNKVY